MSKQNPEEVEQEFFTALIEADQEVLTRLLANDFLLIDVLTGSEISKTAFLEILVAGGLSFEEANRIDFRARNYGSVAVITGQTEITGRLNGRRFEIDSRYTHVFVNQLGDWRMVVAQGTQIVTPPEATK
jgi:ketosteroid isomerase-like protein